LAVLHETHLGTIARLLFEIERLRERFKLHQLLLEVLALCNVGAGQRMPVLLAADGRHATALLRPYPAEELEAYRESTAVRSVRPSPTLTTARRPRSVIG
jgi:hypothetical protein